MSPDSSRIFREATALLARGAGAAALAGLRDAAVRYPSDAAIACRHADALHMTGALAAAAAEYRRALTLDDTIFDAWYGLGCVEIAEGAYGAAFASLTRAVGLEPARADAQFNLGKTLFETGAVDAAIDHFRVASAADDDDLREQARAAIACIIPGAEHADNAAVLAARRAWAGRVEARSPRLVAAGSRRRPHAGKLRIGYVSAFFGARHWMKPVWAVVNHHDRAAFELHFFSDGGDPSAASGYRDHPDDYIHAVGRLGNAELAAVIARTGIDILIDLNAYSAPARLPLIAHHPAPVVLGWFNSFAASGFAGLDYVVGDAAVLPPEEEVFYGERVLRVAGSYLAFNVTYPVPDVTSPPSRRAGGITFGSLASQYKIGDDVVAAWAEILAAVPAARLLLRNRYLDEASNCAHLERRFAAHGIASDRLLVAGAAEHYEFLATYARIDIALDTFPYNGGTTTSEALWQGVPVLTFSGDRWASRTSRSLLEAAGLDDWVMATRAAYVDRAIALARAPETPQRLAALRHDMRRRLAASRAMDSAGLCRQLEAIYRRVVV